MLFKSIISLSSSSNKNNGSILNNNNTLSFGENKTESSTTSHALYNNHDKLITIANVEYMPPSFIKIDDADLNESFKFKILLKQRNLDILENKFWKVSTPTSNEYGKFLNLKEIESIVAPNESDVLLVLEWLLNNGIEKNEIQSYSDYIKVYTSVEKASYLFQAKFINYKSIRTNNFRIRIEGEASIPEYINEKVDFILGLSDFIQDNKKSELVVYKRQQEQLNSDSDSDSNSNNGSQDTVLITPDFIKSYYNITNNEISNNPNNIQSVGSQHSLYSEGALKYFQEQYNLDSSKIITNNIENCLLNGCDQVEPNLDIQYLSSIGNNVTTLYYQLTEEEWVLDWAIQMQTFLPFPLVSSLSYGFGEFDLCTVVPSNCTTLGINSIQYVNRTNIEFQKLGLLGQSILVSSGDEGSLGFYSSSGNCPIDPNYYCPLGGCPHKSTECPSISISLSNGTLCNFPQGFGNNSCFYLFLNSTYLTSINTFIELNNQQCTTTIEYDKSNFPHFYSSCSCDSIVPYYDVFLDLTIASYEFDPLNGRLFDLEFPSTSPYVTSVGATQITSDNIELVCSIQTGAIITSGGGFSAFQSQPDYQSLLVQKYIENNINNINTLPPSYSYNQFNRATPDITLVGHSYSISNSVNQSSNECPCELSIVDGTSASAPSSAGIFSLINDHLLNLNLSPLGFLNPLLYQAAIDQPNVFNKIKSGNINCNGVYCCEYGYSVTNDYYDCSRGLGSINYQNLKNYILSIKSQNK